MSSSGRRTMRLPGSALATAARRMALGTRRMRSSFASAVGRRKGAGLVLQPGPVPVGGHSTTINKTTTDLRRPYATSEAASYRLILDVGPGTRPWASTLPGNRDTRSVPIISIRMAYGGGDSIALCRLRARRLSRRRFRNWSWFRSSLA
jgi:hypothetical protein